MNLKQFKKLKLLDKPGVYFFKKASEILYIGKATSLRDRVKSYFGKDLIDTRGPVILDMVFKADTVKWTQTDSVLEALILEAELIKKYQPKYNTKEKSDKSFNFVCITKETKDDLPKVIIKRGRDIETEVQKFSRIFGPYPNGSQLKLAVSMIRKIFPFLDDKSKNYAEFYRQIGLVPDLKDKRMYLENIKNIKLFFEGKKKKILQNLKKEMQIYAKAREFEKAGEIKRQVFALGHINDIALIKVKAGEGKIFSPAPFFGRIKGTKVGPSDMKILPSSTFTRIEAYDIAHMGCKNMVGVMVVVEDGDVNKNEYRKFKIKTQENANDTGALREVLERRFAHGEWRTPDVIIVDGGVAQINATKKIFKKQDLDIKVLAVLKDERHRPKNILGDKNLAQKYEHEILLANSEAHRFAIKYHKDLRNKNFLS